MSLSRSLELGARSSVANDGCHEWVYAMSRKVLRKAFFSHKIFELRGFSMEAIVILYEISLSLPIKGKCEIIGLTFYLSYATIKSLTQQRVFATALI